ncbi:hypothetical protein PAPYR_5522 [Paratrimastix pyriformis]|uniref:Uncharacterized protein n=1 Tax=Paratrimastix pyriformis TaxID=342808 RepID=A0ABQ8UHQ1_9EUKA|nr:hypothetical protein PAPYR_5522 [Paratrimastix pyriformis]
MGRDSAAGPCYGSQRQRPPTRHERRHISLSSLATMPTHGLRLRFWPLGILPSRKATQESWERPSPLDPIHAPNTHVWTVGFPRGEHGLRPFLREICARCHRPVRGRRASQCSNLPPNFTMKFLLLLTVLGIAMAGQACYEEMECRPVCEVECAPKMVCPPPPPPPKYKAIPVSAAFEKEMAEKEACEEDMNRRNAERMFCDMDNEEERCAEEEEENKKLADIMAASKNKQRSRSTNAHTIDEVMVHKLNDQSESTNECEDEHAKVQKADIYTKNRAAKKAAERQSQKKKAAQEEEACLRANKKGMRAAKKAAKECETKVVPVYGRPCAPAYDYGCEEACD